MIVPTMADTKSKPASPAATASNGGAESPKGDEAQTQAAFQPAGHWAELAEVSKYSTYKVLGTRLVYCDNRLITSPQRHSDDDADAESAIGTEGSYSTASLSSSILQYRTINGRTYHAEQGNAQYW